MRILLTNHHLSQLAGTETWVMTMARHMQRLGHDVGVYSPRKGYVAGLLGDLMDDHPSDYDLALVNHTTTAEVAARAARVTIQTCHGTVPEVEQPAPGMTAHVAVNNATARHHGLDLVIRNPIDTERFAPTSTVRSEPSRFLMVGNTRPPFPTKQPRRTLDNMPELCNWADCVISLGRGALEAMSCARPVITWDYKRGWQPRGDGYVTAPEILADPEAFTAGPYRRTSLEWDDEVANYRPEHGEANRAYIIAHHDVARIAEEYLNLWDSLTRTAT